MKLIFYWPRKPINTQITNIIWEGEGSLVGKLDSKDLSQEWCLSRNKTYNDGDVWEKGILAKKASVARRPM